MSHKYPLLLKPVHKDYLWGGTKLRELFGFESDAETIAESWMLACHKNGTNRIENGACAGMRLDEVLSEWSAEKESFPILVKLIDAHSDLSIQVHPDDSYAYEHEGESGKTEMWYIVDCCPDAHLVYGFNRCVTKDELRQRISDETLTDVLNTVPVKKGDVFFIPAGMIHAIGAGILVAEIQQNSNTTYRVYDYGRVDANGQPRELHIDKALEVMTTDVPTIPYGDIGEVTEHGCMTQRDLAQCEQFTVKSITLDGTVTLAVEKVFICLLILEGEIAVEFDGECLLTKKGDSLYIPQGCSVTLGGKAELLCSTR